MARTMLTFRDNVAMLRASRDEAPTDALTGLGNRRALARDARARAAARDGRRDPLVLVLFDLDGFKHYNDTFGHPAGDALLVRLGAQPRARSSRAAARAFRMGGDEFCALLRPRRAASADAARRRRRRRALRARRGLRDRLLLRRDRRCPPRRPTPPRRCGSPTSACTRRRTPAARRPAARARTCCCARSPSATPSCGSHLGGVADLAEATARRLGLGHDEVEQVRHAAELHDVGKVGDPDAILDQARAARRRRVGVHPPPHADRRADHRRRAGARPASPRSCARATSAGTAPATPTALAGEEIPLGARIVAVADAFDAMTSRAPVRARAARAEAALAELERCAGTQFDPEVVAAFAVACRDGGSPPRPDPSPFRRVPPSGISLLLDSRQKRE